MMPEQLTRVAGAVLAVARAGTLVAPASGADYRLGASRDVPSVNTTKKNPLTKADSNGCLTKI